MTLAPARPDHLVGSAWTRVDTAWRYRHWEIVERHGDEVVLAAVLERACQHRVPWRALRDRAVWLPGWRRVVEDDDDRQYGSSSSFSGSGSTRST